MTAPDLSLLRQELAEALKHWGESISLNVIEDALPVITKALAGAWGDGYRRAYITGVQEGMSGHPREFTAPNPFASGDTTNGEN